ncbi:hypothetical protein HYH02_006427 [Chlamydomonas schloesseri]|uniref:Selenoprotein F n=1 Tax=Chlamydomonas schloesseri TaxID=2026947 RepID=A0A836B5U9_9CHLO|nr:hypothetical protein HYH02_006427 [Chlamydomonas schloesseri]|eukprot:KAG2448536.1 hypothetical protein HYH02_006427 [Chlamydomonas schloesseri]
MRNPFACLLALLLVVGSRAVDDKQARCNELGFISTAVACSDCETLAQFVKDDELVRDCKGCCVQDEAGRKYAKAELIVDQWRASTLQQIKDFIDKRAATYAPQLKVAYTHGAIPKIRLSGGLDGAPIETVRIDNWKADHIAEFLDQRLQRGGSDKDKDKSSKDKAGSKKNVK